MRFLEVAKHFDWVTKAVAGPKAQKGDLKNVRVIDDIREKLLAAPAVAEDGEDPMDALDELDQPIFKVAKRRRGGTKRSDPGVVSLQMPTRPLCVGSKDADQTVYVYLRAGKARSDPKRSTLYIRDDCLDWFLSYAADEHLHQGIVDTAVAEDGAPEGNCPEVPGLRVEWNFSTKVWLAEFVSGPSAGKITRFVPQELTVAN